MTDLHTRHVRDGVERACWQYADHYADVASARPFVFLHGKPVEQ
jgi:hypothetical protein